MAKTLAERIVSARSTDRTTITTLEELIADAKAERERLLGSAEHHDRESIDFALSDDDRADAARLAEHFTRTARALSAEIEALEAKLQEKLSSDKRQDDERAKAAIIARRDDLATRFADRVPALIEELTGLLAEVAASDEEMARAKLYLPSAEAIARGIPGNFYVGSEPRGRFTQMKIPGWDSGHNAWPKAQPHTMALSIESMERSRASMREAEQRERSRWARYSVEAPINGRRTMIETRKGWLPMDRNHVEAWMTAEGVADAEKNGCTVTPLMVGESVGLPSAVVAA